MSKRIIRILLALITVAIISGIFILNPQESVVYFGRGNAHTAPMALILILTFVAGTLFAFALAFVSQFKLSLEAWREKRLRAVERGHLKELVAIRELIALGKYSEAMPKLNQILKEDPDNAVCRALLATCQSELGDLSSALRTLEEGRGRIITSAELYLKAASIYERQGNLTAALDNLSLLLKTHPNSTKVLREGVRVAEKLGEVDRAIHFQERLIKLVDSSEYPSAQEKLAALELLNIEKQPRATQPEEISRLLKKHRNFAPAFRLQAELDHSRGELELSSRSLLKGYEISGDVAYLALLVSNCMAKDNPDRAIKNIRAAVRDRDSIDSRAYLVCLLASLGISDEAKKELELIGQAGLPNNLLELANILVAEHSASTNRNTDHLTSQIKRTLIITLPDAVRKSLEQLGELNIQPKGIQRQKEQPAPQFSTP